MYAKRIQLTNYGPIANLDIEFPFEGETPKPVILVGENGSGKSILLSHIVNGLVAAKGIAFPESPEVELGRVYKLRSSSYIKPGSEYYFGRVDFDGAFFSGEIRIRRSKQEYSDVLPGISETAAEAMWEKIGPAENDYYDSNITKDPNTTKTIKEIFAKNSILYFPFNRFEEPAWLNEENLKAQAQYMDRKHLVGHTRRKVIASSPLHENQNWLFDVIYDRAAFELQTHHVNLPVNDGNATVPLPMFLGYSGDATRTYEAVLEIVRKIKRNPTIRFGIGRRNSRAVSVMSGEGAYASQLVPNIFQLSSGETSLLNLFLSILRDFDLCGTPFSITADIRGIAVVDEIDLHLHAVHQHEVLPELIKVFPNVQFVVTTHSPLFVLGMQRVFGEDGFAVYQLPDGQQITPEEFSEFGKTYMSFANSRRFAEDIGEALEKEKKPILLPEGEIDIRYLQKAAQLLGQQATLAAFQLRDGGGAGNLTNIFKHFHTPLPEFLKHPVVLLFDSDKSKPLKDNGRLYQRSFPLQPGNPLKAGIENLFARATLEHARMHDDTLIDIESEHEAQVEGHKQTVLERCTVNDAQKARLCDWLCEYGDAEDFQAFNEVLHTLAEVLKADSTQGQEEAVAVASDEVSGTDEQSLVDTTPSPPSTE